MFPNSPWVMPNSFRIGALNNPKKKLCPKLEKNVKIKPNIIIFLLIEILIINDFSKLILLNNEVS